MNHDAKHEDDGLSDYERGARDGERSIIQAAEICYALHMLSQLRSGDEAFRMFVAACKQAFESKHGEPA